MNRSNNDIIRLDWGWPSLDLNPTEAVQATANQFFGDPKRVREALHYGAFIGAAEVRETLAHFLAHQRSLPITAEQIFLCAGAGTAIDMLCTLQSGAGQTVLTQSTTYQNALKIFGSHQLKVRALPEDETGQLSLEALNESLSREHKDIALIYLVPTFANPTGQTLNIKTRQGLAELAQRYQVMVVADEVYHPLSFPDVAEPPPVLSHYDESGQYIISLGSFTKIAAPGLRLGWAEVGGAPRNDQDKDNLIKRLSRLGVVQNGGSLNHMTSMLISEFINQGHLNHHLRTLKSTYKARADVLYEALSKRLSPELVSIDEVLGGYYLWLKPSEVLQQSIEYLSQNAEKHGVRYRTGNQFAPSTPKSGPLPRNTGLRLCFAYYEIPELEEGAHRLTRAIIETIAETST